MRSTTLWVGECEDVLGRQCHERATGIAYDVTAIIETGKTRIRRRAEFAGTGNYMIRERQVSVFLKPAFCPAGWQAVG